ncbi:MAG: lamin tail domain-containing protein [Chloroflexota bacterium]|nr:lamin tail domain-containing protein [Chloroflexota bacterium]
MTSTDIGVAEGSSTPVGHSLQLEGTGSIYEDFAWAAPAASTFGAVNTGQTFSGVGPDYTPIHDIQYTTDPSGDSPLIGQEVTTEGIVTARFQYGYFIEDPSGGEWSGLWVYDTNTPALGDRVRITGTVAEYNGLTELDSPTAYAVETSGNPLPDPVMLPTGDVAQEQWEGVLVRLENVTVTNPDLGNGEWSVSDGSGDVRIDDKGNYTYTPVLDDVIDTIVGPLDYSDGDFKIQPRDDGDIVLPTPPAEVVINEVDADMSETDTQEFVELFGTPNGSLDGFILVFYNGNGDVSYRTIDLAGHSLDGAGFFVVGNEGVPNVSITFPNNTLQNGADAVALYADDAANFPNGTLVTDASLVDAVVYDTNDADDPGLLDVLTPGQPQINEGGGSGGSANDAIARVPDGGDARVTTSYVAQAPTPGESNVSGPATTPIYDIQYTTDPGGGSPLVGQVVTTTGIVYAVYGNGFCIAEDSGAWHSIYVYYPSGTMPDTGDEVEVVGEVVEYYGLTELGNYATYTLLSSGNATYAPAVVTAAAIPFDDSASEPYESVFVEVHDIEVTAGVDSHGIWSFTDTSSGTGKADDWGYHLEPNVGDTFNVLRGALIYDWNEYKVMPRDATDVTSLPKIVVTEIMQNPAAVSDSYGEWFEVYNTGSTAVDMDGWTFRDDGSNTFTISGPLVIQPGEYLVLGVNGDTAINGGVELDYDYPGGFALGNGDDEIIVEMGDGTEIDRVEYDGGPVWPDPSGASMMLTDVALDNNDGANWEETPNTLPYGDGDYGTPGCPNTGCLWTDLTISEIQGVGFASLYTDTIVRTSGVVVGLFEGNLPSGGGNFDGFYVQDPTGDGDPATSDGIFVNCGLLPVSVAVGDLVTIIGTVQEFNEYDDPPPETETQIWISNSSDVTVDGTGTVAPTALAPDGTSLYFEAREGMLVDLPVEAYPAPVVGPTSYGTFFVVRGDEGVDRVMRGSPQDGKAFGVRNYTRYGSGGPNLIVGSTANGGIEGPLAYSYGSYLVALQNLVALDYTAVDPPAEPPSWPEALDNELTVVTFNVENFFDTIDDPGKDDPVASQEDYETHRDKIVNAIVQANCPLVVGVQEVEKLAVLQDVAGELATQGCDYTAVLEEGLDGRGIDVGYLALDDRITIEGVWQYQDCTTYDTGLGQGDCPDGEQLLYSRIPLVMTATVQIGPQPDDTARAIFIVNHLKSKLSRAGDPESAQWRLLQAQSLAGLVDQIISANSDELLVVLGDLNDFEDSPPIEALYASGNMTNTWYTLPPEARYSYIYRGTSQVLDHILVSPSMLARLEETGALHINADFPYRPYAEDPAVIWRVSDHDLVATTFAFLPPTAAFTPSATEVFVDETVTFTNESTGDEPLSFLWNFGDGNTSAETSPTHGWTDPGLYTVTLTASNDLGDDSASIEILVQPRIVPFETFEIYYSTIRWSGSKGRFDVIGQLELPAGYTRDDLTRDLELVLSIGEESGNAEVSMTDYGQVWYFYESPPYPTEGVQLTKVIIVWPTPDDPNPPVFMLRGKLSLPGVDEGTRPAEATVNLSLPVTENQPAERVFGEETISFRTFQRLWLYRSWY